MKQILPLYYNALTFPRDRSVKRIARNQLVQLLVGLTIYALLLFWGFIVGTLRLLDPSDAGFISGVFFIILVAICILAFICIVRRLIVGINKRYKDMNIKADIGATVAKKGMWKRDHSKILTKEEQEEATYFFRHYTVPMIAGGILGGPICFYPSDEGDTQYGSYPSTHHSYVHISGGYFALWAIVSIIIISMLLLPLGAIDF